MLSTPAPTETRPAARGLGERERFVAFAFAAADLLLEVNGEGVITFAAGAARARLGRAPEELAGHPADSLFAPEDRHAFAMLLALMPARGRLPPTILRLADPGRTAVSVSGLSLHPGDAGPVSLCIGPVPAPLAWREPDTTVLLREAETRLRAEGGQLALISVAAEAAGPAAALLSAAAGTHGLAAEFAPGRFGLLHGADASGDALREVLDRLEAELGEPVRATRLALDEAGLAPRQAARALRHALSVFARRGDAGLAAAGAAQGLNGVMQRLSIGAGSLRRAIEARRFHLDFQPIVALDSRRLHHHEALLRPDQGAVPDGDAPQDFVRLAECVGLTAELDLAVAALATAATVALPPGQRIAVNLSGLSVQDAGFRRRLLALLDAHPRETARLMVELTESAEVEDEAAAAATLEALRSRGVPVCLDDFGAGAAAFRYLKAFRVDFVKVDGAYVAAALTEERERAFVASMVDLSLAVGAKVIAERVETEEAAAMMLRLGVHYGQGWLFGRPGPLKG